MLSCFQASGKTVYPQTTMLLHFQASAKLVLMDWLIEHIPRLATLSCFQASGKIVYP